MLYLHVSSIQTLFSLLSLSLSLSLAIEHLIDLCFLMVIYAMIIQTAE